MSSCLANNMALMSHPWQSLCIRLHSTHHGPASSRQLCRQEPNLFRPLLMASSTRSLNDQAVHLQTQALVRGAGLMQGRVQIGLVARGSHLEVYCRKLTGERFAVPD